MDIRQKKGIPEGADPLVDSVIRTREFVRKNSTAITACLAAVVILVGGALIYKSVRESGVKKAQEVFGIGVMEYQADRFDAALASFTDAANSYKGTPVGAMSAFMAGSISLQQGNADRAVTWFETAVNSGAGGFVRGQAYEGLATAYEEKGDVNQAVRNLERALRERGAAHRHAAIRWKLALLNRENASTASAYCKELIADTLASAYHQKAENMLAALNAVK